MYRTANQLVFSATDLVDYFFCEHLTQLELARANGLIERPVRDEAAAEVLRKRGTQHENRYLQYLLDSGRDVAVLPRPSTNNLDSIAEAHAKTVRAMRAGTDVIYQAALFDGRWLGFADFLLRVDMPSALGPFSYEVADTKLARIVKASALVQMCNYAEHLKRIQGRDPEFMHVVLGDMRTESYRVCDYDAYYRALKQRFEQSVLSGNARATYPQPVKHCDVCVWADLCVQRRRDDDHLSLVARMRHDQIRKLETINVTTVAGLSGAVSGPRGIGTTTFDALRNQARLQLQQRKTGAVTYELLPPAPNTGLSLLPPPSPGDLFFDMEGDPFVEDGGLEYLFGVVEIESGGSSLYHAVWAHTSHEEKLAFESFVDLVMKRLERHPDLHIYHYASYEPNTLKRLMGTYATREAEIDRLLRGEVFVDLYRVVRQGVRISQESYGLKMLEPLYMPARHGEIKQGGDSIVAYERWLDSHDPAILDQIVDYNADDCRSTWKLRDWLEERRRELAASTGQGLLRPEARASAPTEALREVEARLAGLTDALSEGVPENPLERTPEQMSRWLLGQLLHWHRREDKPEWWAYFQRLRMTDDELVEDSEAIGNLEYVGVVDEVAKSTVHRYTFDPAQEHKLRIGDKPSDPRTDKSAGEIVALDSVTGTIDLKRGKALTAPHPRSVIPSRPVDALPLRLALQRVAEWVIDNGIDAPGPYRAARDLLLGRAPRLVRSIDHSLRGESESALDAARRLVPALDCSYLPIQGPPGSGKTFTGAHVIVDLVRSGKRVGITGPSHRAIGNLLDEVMKQAAREGITVRAIQKVSDTEQCVSHGVTLAKTNDEVADALHGDEVDVVAGTAWLFARPELADTLDTLFVDEAGQVSLANAVAVSGAARNLVLLGDPQQLSQPLKGSHPQGAECSALAHVLGNAATIGPSVACCWTPPGACIPRSANSSPTLLTTAF
jgi:uncharacterized protein